MHDTPRPENPTVQVPLTRLVSLSTCRAPSNASPDIKVPVSTQIFLDVQRDEFVVFPHFDFGTCPSRILRMAGRNGAHLVRRFVRVHRRSNHRYCVRHSYLLSPHTPSPSPILQTPNAEHETPGEQRDFLIHNLLVRIHCII